MLIYLIKMLFWVVMLISVRVIGLSFNNSKTWRIECNSLKSFQFASYIAKKRGFTIGQGNSGLIEERQWHEWWENLLDTAFDPPDFNSLEDKEFLRNLCFRYWGEFSGSYEQERFELDLAMIRQIENAEVSKLVNKFAVSLKKPVPPFELRIVLINYPENYQKSVSKNQFILSQDHLNPARLSDFQKFLGKAIHNLLQND